MSIILLLVGLFAVQSNVGLVPRDFDCPMRELLLEYALEIQPELSYNQLNEISDALNGSPESQNCSISPKLLSKQPKYISKPYKTWDDLKISKNTNKLYVDYNYGSNKNNGTLNFPLKTIEHAIKISTKLFNINHKKYIILREGIHYLQNTIYLSYKTKQLPIYQFPILCCESAISV